jgi:methionyl-tRNA formyltransferase
VYAGHIPYSYYDDINSLDFIQHCRQLNVELAASVSPTQIFKEELINLTKFGCINIHTALLPKYRGLYPTYWAMACGEKTVGITIHYIEKGIDTGRIILQSEVKIPPRTTLDYMLTLTKLKGAELLVEAIRQISCGTHKTYYPTGKGTYFSFPTSDSYKQFRRLGYKLW